MPRKVDPAVKAEGKKSPLKAVKGGLNDGPLPVKQTMQGPASPDAMDPFEVASKVASGLPRFSDLRPVTGFPVNRVTMTTEALGNVKVTFHTTHHYAAAVSQIVGMVGLATYVLALAPDIPADMLDEQDDMVANPVSNPGRGW